ncbi:MAG: GNAT family N-acetyltransferase [Hyphomicrobiaceae bacterium]
MDRQKQARRQGPELTAKVGYVSRYRLRRARPEEAGRLTELAIRSKASNGYDNAFMAACVGELTVTPDRVANGEFWLTELDGRITGFFELVTVDGTAEVMALFVEPDLKNSGVGRALWTKLVQCAVAAGAACIGVGSDPFAQGFYERMGCVVVGTEPSASIPGRVLPRLVLRLPG